MKIKVKQLAAPEGKKVRLENYPTCTKPLYSSKRNYEELLEKHVSELSAKQQVLYATNRYAVLLIFQAMDAAGKDGVIRHVMSGVNPQGCQVFSFKHPSAEELEHDFLWRTTRDLPERGRIGIFNRSYYEEVLIAHVHPAIYRGERLPGGRSMNKVWRDRYRSIINLEQHLGCNGTVILKFFLHISKEEQRKRLLARIEQPEKSWKFSAADLVERGFWNDYMTAYGECLSATTTKGAPWFIIPADDKNNARLIVSQIILNKFKSLKLKYPRVTAARRKELQSIHRKLEQAK
jgi:PPK2 family polyphosphate:nucleotide phosphotransferase